ncbi:protein kinase [Kitasatospora sp. NPDC056138]|uniref:protein kinase domain-containing protein n=1 Tax=Kitasatospora sp. NPDC056138 TaxID=3345724 RepID=UPI0035DAB73A
MTTTTGPTAAAPVTGEQLPGRPRPAASPRQRPDTSDERCRHGRGTPRLLPPDFADYRALRLVREHRCTRVYRGIGTDGQAVAVKTVCADASAPALARVGNEADVLSHLAGLAFVPRLTRTGSHGPFTFLVSEWRTGVTLDDLTKHLDVSLADRSPAAAEAFGDLALALSTAFRLLHQHGVVHGDINSGNVLVSDSGVTVIDFDSATFTGHDRTPPTGISWKYTAGYAAPERLTPRPAPPQPASDQYALAALLYRLAEQRHHVHPHGTPQDLVRRASRPLPPLTRWPVHHWPRLQHVLTRALSHHPADRYPTLAAFDHALATALLLPAAGCNSHHTKDHSR